ncbi:hypothetical protein [Colwellia sp. UCD-KL20]|uniref:hypothetical protein n=1 Tax=Colwellia sp. UCD-KL20 TaxID=1917165 RepID=UPI0011773DF5|nr:hypothetical protein [Colwellia sp. UCD-KL20]
MHSYLQQGMNLRLISLRPSPLQNPISLLTHVLSEALNVMSIAKIHPIQRKLPFCTNKISSLYAVD